MSRSLVPRLDQDIWVSAFWYANGRQDENVMELHKYSTVAFANYCEKYRVPMNEYKRTFDLKLWVTRK